MTGSIMLGSSQRVTGKFANEKLTMAGVWIKKGVGDLTRELILE